MRIKFKHKLYHHVQWNLTFLFTGITALVLFSMIFAYLYMSEKEWHEKSFLSFLNTSNTMITNLEHQDTLQFSWLSTVSHYENYIVAVYDNGTLLSYCEANLSEHEKSEADSALAAARPDLSYSSASDTSSRKDFTFVSDTGNTYYANAAQFGPGSSPLFTVILYSTHDLASQLHEQRLRFLAGGITGLFLLLLFTYFYIGKLMAPIQENQKKQTEFIAAASHELRTPIAVILASLSAFRKADREAGTRFLMTIEKESRRMSALVNDLLLLSKTSGTLCDFTMEKTELDTLVLNTWECFLPLASEKNMHLDIELPEGTVPPCLCDAARITQLLGILISNAVSYGKKGGVIKLSLSHSSPYFVLTCQDNGCGISDQAKPHIFERFYREDASRSKKEHFGLGLCIAKEIAEAHSGYITVSDTPGGGATFTVYLRNTSSKNIT